MDTVAFPDSSRGRSGLDADLAWFGALTAVGLCMLIAIFGFIISPPMGALFGAVGMPGTVILAYRLAPSMATADRLAAVWLAARLSFEAILIADALTIAGIGLMVLASVIGAPSSGSPGLDVAGAIGAIIGLTFYGVLVFLVGLLLVGGPAALVVLPAALLWSVVIRSAARRRSADFGRA
jgi:hypothetical protein